MKCRREKHRVSGTGFASVLWFRLKSFHLRTSRVYSVLSCAHCNGGVDCIGVYNTVFIPNDVYVRRHGLARPTSCDHSFNDFLLVFFSPIPYSVYTRHAVYNTDYPRTAVLFGLRIFFFFVLLYPNKAFYSADFRKRLHGPDENATRQRLDNCEKAEEDHAGRKKRITFPGCSACIKVDYRLSDYNFNLYC